MPNMRPDASSWLLLQEYKIMLDTSERMMDRRQGTNSFYITLCTAMLTVIVGFVATKANTFAWSAVTFVISGMMLLRHVFTLNNTVMIKHVIGKPALF